MDAIQSLETMKEGHDGSGLGLIMRNLGGSLEKLKNFPILSAAATRDGFVRLEEFMVSRGFKVKYRWDLSINHKPSTGIVKRDHYVINVYEYPEGMEEASEEAKALLLTTTRLDLRALGEADQSIYVYSFWPDTVTLKEVGDPMQVGEFFGMDRDPVLAKTVFAQGRQNTNYAINLYACHPFFVQGYFTMTNGENTAFVPIRDYLKGRGVPGYVGYNSDSEVFAHILHYTRSELGYPLRYYKDIITPLSDEEIGQRADADAIRLMKKSLRMLTIDGPNCVIGCDLDGSVFMTQDAKKLRPGVVGGEKGRVGFMSEVCGLASAVPGRDEEKDVFPMKYDLVVVRPGAQEIEVCNQLDGSTSTISLA
jgi:glutamate synthase domain-containing protein 1